MAGAFTHNGNVVEGLPSIASQINYSNTSSGMQATQVQAAIDELNTNKQPKTDNNLTTTSKETTGAINELKSGLTNKEPFGGATTGNKTFSVGGNLELRTDGEGGNIVITSPNNVKFEIDAYNDTLRVWSQKSGNIVMLTWDGINSVNLSAMPKIYHGTVTSDNIYGMITVPNATNSLIVLVGDASSVYHLDYNNPNVFILRDSDNRAVTNTSVEIMAMYI